MTQCTPADCTEMCKKPRPPIVITSPEQFRELFGRSPPAGWWKPRPVKAVAK